MSDARRQTAIDRLRAMPKVDLLAQSTPIERLDRLREALRSQAGGASSDCPEIWVKRDDLTSVAGGGNKVRKLEYLLGEALAAGCDSLVTLGAIQSNHARQTAAIAARLGLACHLILADEVPEPDPAYRTSGNILLARLLGAEVRIVPANTDLQAEGEILIQQLRSVGSKPFLIPVGGSNATGTLGYASAVGELPQDLRFDRIVVPTGSGGTHAGLLVGITLWGLPTRVHGIAVSGTSKQKSDRVRDLVRETCRNLGLEPDAVGPIEVDDSEVGPGYGIPTTSMINALEQAARAEGLLLDPVYTGKAFAGLLRWIREGVWPTEARVLFWHTGGIPGLFAYPRLWPDAERGLATAKER